MDTNEMTEKAQEWQERAKDWKEKAQYWQQRASETARNTAESVDGYVHENVWMSIGTAALIGCVVGFMIGRSRD